MKVLFEKGEQEIKSLGQWQKLGHPKSSQHWTDGRSSKEMAVYAIGHLEDFKMHIEGVLKECNIELQDFNCEPEATAGLGKGMKRGGPRNHDLLMRGQTNCVIGVEAKVSEGFDKELWKVIKDQTKKKDEKETRAYQLKKFLAPNADVDELGYQLFTATRATMMAARERNYTNSILLIVVFTGKVSKNKGEREEDFLNQCRKNDEDFENFKKAIRADKNGMIQREIEGKMINCWIKKIKVHLPDYKVEEY